MTSQRASCTPTPCLLYCDRANGTITTFKLLSPHSLSRSQTLDGRSKRAEEDVTDRAEHINTRSMTPSYQKLAIDIQWHHAHIVSIRPQLALRLPSTACNNTPTPIWTRKDLPLGWHICVDVEQHTAHSHHCYTRTPVANIAYWGTKPSADCALLRLLSPLHLSTHMVSTAILRPDFARVWWIFH